MPNWKQVLEEIQGYRQINALDFVRKKYLHQLSTKTGRNVIAYYSGWLQKPDLKPTSINDDDKNGLMANIHGLDRSLGLDLLLHTPGGNTASTESIVHYLRQMFGTNIRAFIPQLAMSAGTMIACACKEIYMGKQSNIGPIDPQFNGIPAHGVIAEFDRALKATKKDQKTIPIWQAVISKYHPTFIGECQHAIELSSSMVIEWLTTGMFNGDPQAKKRAKAIVNKLNNHKDSKTHARHIPMEKAVQIGLKIIPLECDNDLQDLVLTIHHSYMHTFASSSACKIIENNMGSAVITNTAAIRSS